MSSSFARPEISQGEARGLTAERVLGRVRGARPGPTLLCVGGLHGNEPAGVLALRAVLARLGGRVTDMRGDFVALTGNRTALAQGRRFVDRDLNRAWTLDRVARLTREGVSDGHVEDREQVELLDAIEDVVEQARGPVYVLDLHTTSGFGGIFSTFGDTLPNREFAAHIPVPMVLGLEELVEGTLLGFLGSHGVVAVVYESGQHDEPESVVRAEAGIWLAVAAARLLPEHRLPEAASARKLLARASNGLPKAMEMRYRHDVRPNDAFRMEPGFRSFTKVTRGQVVARDADGDVRVGESGMMLMPLYQEQGEDGFFLIREFRPLWLRVSYILRSARVDRFAHWLPGVHRDPHHPEELVVNRSVARWLALQLFHLLGFRKHEDDGGRLVMRRRRYDEVVFVKHGPPPAHLR